MKQLIERAKVRAYCATEIEWNVVIAATALVAIFAVIMTGHIAIKY